MKIFCNSCEYEVQDGLQLVRFFVSFFSRYMSFPDGARIFVKRSRPTFFYQKLHYKTSAEQLKAAAPFCRNHFEFYPPDFWEKTTWDDFASHILSNEGFLEKEQLKQRFFPGNHYACELYHIVLHDMLQWFFDRKRNIGADYAGPELIFRQVQDLAKCIAAVADELKEEYPNDAFGFKTPKIIENNPDLLERKNGRCLWTGTPVFPNGEIIVRDNSDSFKYIAFLGQEGLAIESYNKSCLKNDILNFLDNI